MNKPRFKKGDKVVFVGKQRHFFPGETLTVQSHYVSDSTPPNHCYWFKEVTGEPCIEQELELLHIYTSPLYKALS
jgi:hypothetical protein